MPTAQTCRLVLAHFILITICYLNYSTQNDCDSSSSILLYYDNVTFNTSKGCLDKWNRFSRSKPFFLPLILFLLIIHSYKCLNPDCLIVTKPGHNSFLTLLIKISMFQHFGTTHFLVFNTGVVLWVPPAKFRAFCKVATILLIPSATFSMATKIL